MARRDIPMNEVVETIYQWHKGSKVQKISQSLDLDRKTIRKYLGMARSLGIERECPLPDEQLLIAKLKGLLDTQKAAHEKPVFDLVAGYRDAIKEWFEDPYMTGKQVWRLLKEVHGIKVGYTTVKRYLRKEFSYGKPAVTIRMETPPGLEAQVDFGYVGLMVDPKTQRKRKTWAFIMTLSYSRHKYVRFVFRQDIPSWLDCHQRAFLFFGGVPERIVLDSLKSGVIKPDIYDPTMNYAYANLERHYGFIADPAKVRTPEHKGKVERTVPIVRKHLLAGRVFKDITEANERALTWCRDEIGMEVHGTTKKKPYPSFLAEEKSFLRPLPAALFETPLWKKCTVHSDHHIIFEQSYYSLPTRYIGEEVWAKGIQKVVEIYLDHERIKVHPRAQNPGTWMTDQTDYPPDKLAFLLATPAYCRKKAAEYGPHTETLMNAILRENAVRNLRKGQAILRLAEKYPGEIEKVSERALLYGNTQYKSIRTMLEKGMTDSVVHETTTAPLSEMGQRFLRSPSYFGGAV
jgi:transposase